MSQFALILPPIPDSITASAALATAPASYLSAPDRNHFFASGTTSVTLDFDFLTAVAIDAVALCLTNLSATATIQIRCAATSGGLPAGTIALANTTAVAAGDPSNRPHVMHTFAVQTQRFWRIEISDVAGAGIEISRAMLGRFFNPEWGVALGGNEGVADSSKITVTPYGQAQAVAGIQRLAFDVELPEISEAEWLDQLRPHLAATGLATDTFIILDTSAAAPWQQRHWVRHTRAPRGVRQLLNSRALRLSLEEL